MSMEGDGRVQPVSGLDPVRQYFQTLRKILSSPRRFFAELEPRSGISGPLVFALVTHWVARCLEYFWNSSIGGGVLPYWRRFMGAFGQNSQIESLGRLPWFHETRDLVLNWFWGAGSVLIDPFVSIFKLLLSSLILFVAARMLITPRSQTERRPVTFEAMVRVVSYGSAPAIFAIVPWIGTPIAALYGLIVVVIGVCETFSVQVGRALVIALFPKILFVGMLLAGALVVLLFMMKIFSSF